MDNRYCPYDEMRAASTYRCSFPFAHLGEHKLVEVVGEPEPGYLSDEEDSYEHNIRNPYWVADRLRILKVSLFLLFCVVAFETGILVYMLGEMR